MTSTPSTPACWRGQAGNGEGPRLQGGALWAPRSHSRTWAWGEARAALSSRWGRGSQVMMEAGPQLGPSGLGSGGARLGSMGPRRVPRQSPPSRKVCKDSLVPSAHPSLPQETLSGTSQHLRPQWPGRGCCVEGGLHSATETQRERRGLACHPATLEAEVGVEVQASPGETLSTMKYKGLGCGSAWARGSREEVLGSVPSAAKQARLGGGKKWGEAGSAAVSRGAELRRARRGAEGSGLLPWTPTHCSPPTPIFFFFFSFSIFL